MYLRDKARIPSGQDGAILPARVANREIRFILPAHGARHIIIVVTKQGLVIFCLNKLPWKHEGPQNTLYFGFSCSQLKTTNSVTPLKNNQHVVIKRCEKLPTSSFVYYVVQKQPRPQGQFNPLRPNSDLKQTSHWNIKGLSVRKVMRIENMIT